VQHCGGGDGAVSAREVGTAADISRIWGESG